MEARSTRGELHRRRSGRARAALEAIKLLPALVVVLTLAMPAMAASAYWSGSGSGAGIASTGVLAPPTDVVVPATSVDEVPVQWMAAAGASAVEGYYVARWEGGAPVWACGSSPDSLLTTDACIDPAVAPGTYTYVVTSVRGSWTADSASSSPVVVTRAVVPVITGPIVDYSVFAVTDVTNTLASTLSGDLGVATGAAPGGFPPGEVAGTTHVADVEATAAAANLQVAYLAFDALEPDDEGEIDGDLADRTLLPGIYHSTAALEVTRTLTLDAQGDPEAMFVFQVDAAFDTAAGSRIALTGGARPDRVIWQVEAAVTIGADSFFTGTILGATAITLGERSEIIGQALSQGTVTMADNDIRFSDALPSDLTIDGAPSVVTDDTTPRISGSTTAGPGRTVTVTVDRATPQEQTLTAFVQRDGTWAVSLGELQAGDHAVSAVVRDAYRNVTRRSIVLEVIVVGTSDEPAAGVIAHEPSGGMADEVGRGEIDEPEVEVDAEPEPDAETGADIAEPDPSVPAHEDDVLLDGSDRAAPIETTSDAETASGS
jgi:hypothetical protein